MRRPLALTALALVAGAAAAQDAPPFGGEEDRAYAGRLWEALEEMRLAGADAIDSIPVEGTEPHGAMLETFHATLELDGREGRLSVKRNYRPTGLSRADVQGARDEHLGSVTVMYRRAKGYDPENSDWFWVKYLPDGSLDENPKGMKLAGRVAKGMDQGCIACHSAAPGDDYLFTADATSE